MQTINDYTEHRKRELTAEILDYKHIDGDVPCIAIIQIGDDPFAKEYAHGKLNLCEELGIKTVFIKFSDHDSEQKILKKIRKLNKDKKIDGITIQTPIPLFFNKDTIKSEVSPNKDIDGYNKNSNFMHVIPYGIYRYFKDQNFPLTSKNVIVIGRSKSIGKPIADLLLNSNCNVTVLHSRTRENDLKKYLSIADIVISATGKKDLLKQSYKYKASSLILDVGINKDDEGHLCGDCEENLPVKYQSPVPGGVWMLSKIALVDNLILAFNKRY